MMDKCTRDESTMMRDIRDGHEDDIWLSYGESDGKQPKLRGKIIRLHPCPLPLALP